MILQQLEAQLGEHIQILHDKLDLQIRQGDSETIAALQSLTQAWETLAVLLAAEQRAKKLALNFAEVKHGDSVVDSLFEYACEAFPRAAACQRAMKGVETHETLDCPTS